MTPHESLSLAIDEVQSGTARVALGAQAVVLRDVARGGAPELIATIETIGAVSPFRHTVTPSGGEMSVALTNCGQIGWVADQAGLTRLIRRPAGHSLRCPRRSRILPSKRSCGGLR